MVLTLAYLNLLLAEPDAIAIRGRDEHHVSIYLPNGLRGNHATMAVDDGSRARCHPEVSALLEYSILEQLVLLRGNMASMLQ